MAAILSESLCKHHQFGYCKFQKNCRKQHVSGICQIPSCTMEACNLWHPKSCKYFSVFGVCKFGERCAYIHKKLRDDAIAKLEEQKEILQTEVVNLIRRVDMLEKLIVSFSSQNDPSDNTSARNS